MNIFEFLQDPFRNRTAYSAIFALEGFNMGETSYSAIFAPQVKDGNIPMVFKGGQVILYNLYFSREANFGLPGKHTSLCL